MNAFLFVRRLLYVKRFRQAGTLSLRVTSYFASFTGFNKRSWKSKLKSVEGEKAFIFT